MTITREQAIKEIISTASCLEQEWNSQKGKIVFLFKGAAIEQLKALGITEEEIRIATTRKKRERDGLEIILGY